MTETCISALKEAIEKSRRPILIWGACERNVGIQRIIEGWGFSVDGFIDRKHEAMQLFNGKSVYGCERLSAERYFIFVGIIGTSAQVLETLETDGYVEFTDYWYPARSVLLDGTKNYSDLYGNSLTTTCTKPCSVKLVDGGKCVLGNSQVACNIISAYGGTVIIGNNTTFGKGGDIKALSGTIQIDDNCDFAYCCLFRTSCNGFLHICDNTTAQFQSTFVASLNSKIIIGKDCMISYSVYVRSGNSHNIIDLDTGENLDMNDRRNVIIGEHVWFGMRATVMSGAQIGSGSTVGANSFVNKKFPNNCAIAGNPARIVRNRTAWIRDGRKIHNDPADYADFIFDA